MCWCLIPQMGSGVSLMILLFTSIVFPPNIFLAIRSEATQPFAIRRIPKHRWRSAACRRARTAEQSIEIEELQDQIGALEMKVRSFPLWVPPSVIFGHILFFYAESCVFNSHDRRKAGDECGLISIYLYTFFASNIWGSFRNARNMANHVAANAVW